VQATVTVAQSIAQQLLHQGIPVPQPIAGSALIDTGASATCVDDAVAQSLGLPVIDVVQVASASHAATLQNVYPVLIELIGTGITINADRVIGAPLAAQDLLLLIGRDVLEHCTLHYNGIAGEITLSL
jgi:predicted aspartyl protease